MKDRYDYYDNWIKRYRIGDFSITSHPNTDTKRFYIFPCVSFQLYRGYFEVLICFLNYDHYISVEKINRIYNGLEKF